MGKRGNSNKPTEDDPWVEYLGEVAIRDSDYLAMVHHLEAGTDIKDINKDCELSKCHNYKDRLSVITLKGGQTLILRENGAVQCLALSNTRLESRVQYLLYQTR